MVQRMKNRIKELVRNLVYEGVLLFFEGSEIKNFDNSYTSISNQTALKYNNFFVPLDLNYHPKFSSTFSSISLNKCELVQGRNAFISLQKKECVCIEIGVGYGDFSKQILKIMSPEEFILFDEFNVTPGCGDMWGMDLLANSKLSHLEFVRDKFADKKNVYLLNGKPTENLQYMTNDYIDFAYICLHNFNECAEQIIDLLLNKVKKGGIIVLCDAVPFSPISTQESNMDTHTLYESISIGKCELKQIVFKENGLYDFAVEVC